MFTFPSAKLFWKKKARQLRLRHVVSKKEKKKGIKAKAGLESYKGQSS